MSWWCKGSTHSRHVRGHGFDSRVRTLFSIHRCCIYLVFTMLFVFVKRLYISAWCSVHCVKVARFPGMSEVSGSIPVSLFSIDLCCIYPVFTMLFIFVKCMYSYAWCSVHGLVPYSFLTLIERAPPALHLRPYNIVHLCVFIVG